MFLLLFATTVLSQEDILQPACQHTIVDISGNFPACALPCEYDTPVQRPFARAGGWVRGGGRCVVIFGGPVTNKKRMPKPMLWNDRLPTSRLVFVSDFPSLSFSPPRVSPLTPPPDNGVVVVCCLSRAKPKALVRTRARKEPGGGSDGVAPASAVRDEAFSSVDPVESGSEKAAEAAHAEGIGLFPALCV